MSQDLQPLHKRVRDSSFYKKTNAPLVQSVKKELFPVNWDLDVKKYPRILIHPADFSGCGYYRLIYPMRQLIEKKSIQAFATNNLYKTHEIAKYDPDVMIFQRQVYDHQVKYLERAACINQVYTIFEIDDLLDNIPEKSVHHKDFTEQHVKNLYRQLSTVNRFVCSTEFIKECYYKYAGEKTIVVPNMLNKDVWLPLENKRQTSKKLRVGWSGGYSHTGDLEIIVDTVKALYKEVDFVFMGYVHPEIEPYIKEFRPSTRFEHYPKSLASMNLDLAIIPLEDVPFNHGKSHLKVLEFGVLGVPVIASPMTPYKNFPVVHAKTNDANGFIEAIRDTFTLS